MDEHESHHQPVSSTFLMDTSLAPLRRRFERLNDAFHAPFSAAKTGHSPSIVFDVSKSGRWEHQRVLAGFEPDWEKLCPELSDRLKEMSSVGVYLVFCGVNSQNTDSRSFATKQEEIFVSIPDTVEELCESCFRRCASLSRVRFGESSSLKVIRKEAFACSGLREIQIPDSVEELCESCFAWCRGLSRVTFGESSSLKVIGKGAFRWSGVYDIHIPDSVEELCAGCFEGCKRLLRVRFGESSSLKVIRKEAFACSGLREIHIPDSVEELCESCFKCCERLLHVRFGESSSLKLIGKGAFLLTRLSYFSLPASVVSVGGGSFVHCPLRNFVISDIHSFFSVVGCLLLSKDRRVCYSCIGNVEEVMIPDSVEELCESCFKWCKSLSRVRFGESSSLKVVRKEAFACSGLREIQIPDSVEELCESCFEGCERLLRVRFGESSSLKVLSKTAFEGSRVAEIQIPDRFEELLRGVVPDSVGINSP